MSNYTLFRDPPPNRRGKHAGEREEYMPEAAVMIAFAMYLRKLGALVVELHPDGEHGKGLGIRHWFESRGYTFTRNSASTTDYAGTYVARDFTIVVSLSPGRGDVVASLEGRRVLAECKGGTINSTHAGLQSKLRHGICEVVGLLLSKEQGAERHFAVVPDHKVTRALAAKMQKRVRKAGIEIALVKANGEVELVEPV